MICKGFFCMTTLWFDKFFWFAKLFHDGGVTTIAIWECIFKLPFVVKSDLQTSQLKDFFIDFSILVNIPLLSWTTDDYWLSRQENYRKQETEQACYCYENFQQINHATCHLWYQTSISGIHETSVSISSDARYFVVDLLMPISKSTTK